MSRKKGKERKDGEVEERENWDGERREGRRRGNVEDE